MFWELGLLRVGIATRLWSGRQGFDFRQRKEFFSFLYRVKTGSEAHPGDYPLGAEGSFPEGKSAKGVKLTTRHHLVPRLRVVELYIHSPILLHGLVLN
jgi:hypothetical protein